MKRIVFIIVLVFAIPFFVKAQAPAKSFIVDTVITPYFDFDYMEWVNSDPHHPLLSTCIEGVEGVNMGIISRCPQE